MRKPIFALAAVAVVGVALNAASGATYLEPSASQQVNSLSRGLELAVPGADAIAWPNPFRFPQSVAAEWPVKVAQVQAAAEASLPVPSPDSYAWPNIFQMPAIVKVEWTVAKVVAK